MPSPTLDELFPGPTELAGLMRRMQTGLPVEGTDGLTPREQLALIAIRTDRYSTAACES